MISTWTATSLLQTQSMTKQYQNSAFQQILFKDF